VAAKPDEFSLRPLLEVDEGLIRTWRNSDPVRMHMFSPELIAMKEHQRWFADALAGDPNRYRVLLGDSRPLGFVSFSPVADTAGAWAWSLYVGDPTAPRGSGSALGSLALDHAFTNLGACTVVSETMADNKAALALYGRLGFVRIGTRQVTRRSSSGPEDVVILSISRAAWSSSESPAG